jgi:uncharacterized Ntn-hydrolase superfamily protein
MFTRAVVAGFATAFLLALPGAAPVAAQEPAAWGAGPDIEFTTFSIAAIDPETGESGTAVTTRNPCVGNGVPWVRKGVGAVATQASTRTEYGYELLDMMARGVAPRVALDSLIAKDPQAGSRQIGVIGVDGRSAQHSRQVEGFPYTGTRSGPTYVVQGNTLAGREVLDAVEATFKASEGKHRQLADRLIEALNAGHVLGGDRRHGTAQSAAVIVADPRPGRARRQDGQTVFINVCEHADPLAEMRRVYNAISETLGFRELAQVSGNDVFQLKLMLNALGYFRPGQELTNELEERTVYTKEAIDAVDAFRKANRMDGAHPGLVDGLAIQRMWSLLEEQGKANAVRERLLAVQRINR